ncbi:MAG: hypothetical protein U9O56_06635 [Campylobacterota bacterium]|nr:hypothetical protein [Campylobacterota bacterium]
MNIYIYGGNSFRTEIHKVLDHGNVRFKIEDGNIIDIILLDKLKETIKENPSELFLIDQTKIIEDDFISKYLKFLVPKDGISKHFLDQYGLGDISLRELKDLIIYIDKRIEAMAELKPKLKAEEITTIEEMFDCYA